jgi:hypothetical protein
MKAATVTAAYAVFYPRLCEVARANGYALAIHGTMQRDCDLVAIPWTDEAVDPVALVNALQAESGGCWTHPEWDDIAPNGTPTKKPHGRVAYSVHLTDRGGQGPYFDISVMPRASSDSAAKRVFDASQALWHASGVERHAEGSPGLLGPPGLCDERGAFGPSSGEPWNPEGAYIASAIYALKLIQARLYPQPSESTATP